MDSESWPDYLYYRDQNHVFSGVLAYTRLTFLVSGGDLPENVSGELASDNYFGVLGAAPQLGRVFVAGERGDVVVLSDRYWRERFHADSRLITMHHPSSRASIWRVRGKSESL